MLTNPRDAFRGQSRSPNMVPFDMLGMVSYSIFSLNAPFGGDSTSKHVVTLKYGSKVTQGHRNRHLWLPINVPATQVATVGPSHTISEIHSFIHSFIHSSIHPSIHSFIHSEVNGKYSRKSQIFPTPVYFAPPLTGFPLEFGIGVRCQQVGVMGLLGGKEVCWYLQPCEYNPPTWLTDG